MRWGCQRNNQRSPKTLLFVFRRFACRPAAFLSVWGGQPEREASLFNLKFLAARVRVYVRQLADGVGMNATFLLSISSFIKLPTLEKCEHKNSFIHILLYKFVAHFSYSNYTIKLVNSSTATLDYMRTVRTVFCPDFLAQSYINSVFTTSSASDRTISSMRFRAASSISVQYCLTYTQLSLEGASLRFSCTPPHGLPASGRPAAPSTAPWRPPAPPPA